MPTLMVMSCKFPLEDPAFKNDRIRHDFAALVFTECDPVDVYDKTPANPAIGNCNRCGDLPLFADCMAYR